MQERSNIPSAHELLPRARGRRAVEYARLYTTPDPVIPAKQRASSAQSRQGIVEVALSPNNTRGRDLLTVCLSLLLVICLSVGATLAYFTATNTSRRVIPLETLSLSLQGQWSNGDSLVYMPGLTILKAPTLIAEEGESYARVRVRILEGQGVDATPITDIDRLSRIMQVLYCDSGSYLTPGESYTSAELAGLVNAGVITASYDPNAYLPGVYAGEGTYYFEHRGVMLPGVSAELFNRVVIPSDMSSADLLALGSFTLSVEGEAIQSFGFASQQEAMEELDRTNW